VYEKNNILIFTSILWQ